MLYQVEVSATGLTFVQRYPSECGVSVYDLETSIMGGIGPSKVVAPLGGDWKNDFVFVTSLFV